MTNIVEHCSSSLKKAIECVPIRRPTSFLHLKIIIIIISIFSLLNNVYGLMK
jgi:hypothetical protein